MPIVPKISFNTDFTAMKIQEASDRAIAATAKQAREDCNRYCPDDQDALVNSSYTHSDILNGYIEWRTPYARFQYYGVVMVDPHTGSPYAPKNQHKVVTKRPLKYHPKNESSTPCKMWCEKAYNEHKEKWHQIFIDAFNKGV